MARIEMQTLNDNARIWVFGISPALDEARSSTLLRHVDTFLADWGAHGHPIRSAREIREGSFLIIAIEKTTENSGCSIDRLFGTLRQVEAELGVSILESNRVFFRHGDGRADAMTRAAFREQGDLHTTVFDTTAQTLGEIRNGTWERRAEESWHRDLLGKRTAG